MNFKNMRLFVALLGLLGLLAACGDVTATVAPATPARTTLAATTAVSSTAKTTSTVVVTSVATNVTTPVAGVNIGPNSKEVARLKAVVPNITNTLAALKKGDVTAAKAALQAYSDAWNGIEVYVKTRSAQLYDQIEVQNELKANALFESDKPNSSEILPYVEGVQKGYTEAIKLAETGPAYNPILDEIADLRILRVNLRNTITALKTTDLETAKTAFKKFDDGWSDIEQIISSRDKTIYQEIEVGIGKVGGNLLRNDKPNVAEVTASADALLTKYNDGLKILTTALSNSSAIITTKP